MQAVTSRPVLWLAHTVQYKKVRKQNPFVLPVSRKVVLVKRVADDPDVTVLHAFCFVLL